MVLEGSTRFHILMAVGIVGLFGFLTFALTAATLGAVNKQYSNMNSRFDDLQLRLAIISERLTVIINATTNTTTAAPEMMTTITHTTNIDSTDASQTKSM